MFTGAMRDNKSLEFNFVIIITNPFVTCAFFRLRAFEFFRPSCDFELSLHIPGYRFELLTIVYRLKDIAVGPSSSTSSEHARSPALLLPW